MWHRARTAGAPCELTANGPGAFRLDGDARAFRAAYLAAFGRDAAGPLACVPAPSDPARAPALDAIAAATSAGLPDVRTAVAPAAVPAATRTRLVVDLGPDPLGLARRLGLPRAALLRAGRPQVWALSPGHVTSARLDARGRAVLLVAPAAPGPVRLELRVRAAALRVPGAAEGWFDRLVAAGAPAAEVAALVRFPATWRLRLPLAIAGAPPVGAVAALPPVTRITVSLTRRRTPTGRRVLVVAARRADGTAAAYTPVVVRLRAARPYTVRTDARGLARVTAVRGAVLVRTPDGRVRARLVLPPV